MKKLLAVSVLAIMAVSTANAEIASVDYTERLTGDLINLTTSNKTNLTSAINEVAGKVNSASTSLDTKVDVDQTAENKNKAVITDANGKITTGQIAAGMIASNAVTSAKIGGSAVTADKIATGAVTNVKIADGTIVNADISNDAKIAQSKIDGLEDALAGKAEDATTLAGYGITDAYTKDEVNDKMANESSLLNTRLEDVEDTVKVLPTTYAPINTVENAEQEAIEAASKAITDIIGTGFSSASTVAQQLSSVKATAEGAVQSVGVGASNGTISVDGTDVAVKGLGSAAYTASTAYATAAQGKKADSAMQLETLKTDKSWTEAGCGTEGVVCSLISRGGQLAWEKVAY